MVNVCVCVCVCVFVCCVCVCVSVCIVCAHRAWLYVYPRWSVSVWMSVYVCACASWVMKRACKQMRNDYMLAARLQS